MRLLVVNGMTGTFISVFVTSAVLYMNIGNLGYLISTADDPVLPVLMLGFGLFVTLGSVVIGSAIMLVGEKEDDAGSGPGLKQRLTPQNLQLEPVLVPARAPERR
ncbi:hypothetical protein SAMN06265374_1894 [Roseibium denhamense]|uniref:Uncharacterized protein n=2 Tax=Roseibium denhamense TaxID=76305 RepID=A0ABY1NU65_9HYPH|nr:hypothetical protein SAMN06265374_1894 [Roseibium denhamense]